MISNITSHDFFRDIDLTEQILNFSAKPLAVRRIRHIIARQNKLWLDSHEEQMLACRIGIALAKLRKMGSVKIFSQTAYGRRIYEKVDK